MMASLLEIGYKRRRKHKVKGIEKLGKREREKDKHARKEREALVSGREKILFGSTRKNSQTIIRNPSLVSYRCSNAILGLPQWDTPDP